MTQVQQCSLYIIILLYYLLPVSSGAGARPTNCNKCTTLPADCQPRNEAPFDNGPPCACTTTYHPKGCTLKPCDLIDTDDICDCTLSTGSLKNTSHPHRFFCRKYQCTGTPGECETCKELPPDCTQHSYFNPPSAGGPDCACEVPMTPGGCTLKTCISGNNTTPDPCVPTNGITEPSSFTWYGTTCQGKWNGTVDRIIVIYVDPAYWYYIGFGVFFILVGILSCWLFDKLEQSSHSRWSFTQTCCSLSLNGFFFVLGFQFLGIALFDFNLILKVATLSFGP